MRQSNSLVRLLLLSSSAMIALPHAAMAQDIGDDSKAVQNADVESGDNFGEIIVTARKRNETLQDVPVAITAVTSAELSRNAINGVDSLARKIPGLVVGEGGGTVQGGSISLRGISAADSNPLGDQAVSFNIDGVQVARSSVRRMGDFDIASVEVLKGPQALFFGKNSPGGIISTTTADPTDRLEIGGKIGYEFNADEVRGEGYVSGPLTDSIGARLAVYGSTMKGWVDNVLEPGDPLASSQRTPKNDEYAGRLTLKYDNGGPFRARFKLSHNNAEGNSSTANLQVVNCPSGRPLGGIGDCKPDDRILLANLGPNMANISALAPGELATVENPSGNPDLPYSSFGDGSLFSRSKQWLSGLELNFDVTDALTVTSVTGFYKSTFNNRANFTLTNVAPAVLGSVNFLDIREISQELRLASDYAGPINFLVGGQYQDSKVSNASLAAFNATNPFAVSNYSMDQDGEAYSFFGQVQFTPVEEIEIAAGGRYSHEEKVLTSAIINGGQLVDNRPFLSDGLNKKTFNNFSPEISLSYKPTRDLNLYANYKRGFLSGGFNGGSTDGSVDLSYDPQKVKGFEAGIKSRLADGMISADLALYSYKITDLQVQVTEGVTQLLRNAGKVSSKGAEFSLSVRPATGVSIYGNVAYADADYVSYYASCYRNQVVGTGIGECGIQPNPGAGGALQRIQNLSGTTLIRSPEWTGNAGFVYETPVSAAMDLELAGGLTFSDGYITNAASQPDSESPSYTLFDASIRLLAADESWELALLGRNLTDKYYFVRTSANPAGPAVAGDIPDAGGSVSRGREIMVRVGFKY